MTEAGLRVLVVLLIVALAAGAAVRAGRTKRARPIVTARADLPPGVHLFTSATCGTCAEARQVIIAAYGGAFTEVRHEDDPQSFGHHGISRVPTAVVVFAEGKALVFEGVPRARDLPGLGVVSPPPQ